MGEAEEGGVIEIHEYMQRQCGGRSRGFSVGKATVLVTPDDGESDGHAKELTAILANAAVGAQARWDLLEQIAEAATTKLVAAEREIAALRDRIPPSLPARLLGPGTVRFDEAGALWLLSRRDGGWSSFGIRLDGWDDLFRRYAVRITGHGVDAHGAWWEASP